MLQAGLTVQQSVTARDNVESKSSKGVHNNHQNLGCRVEMAACLVQVKIKITPHF